MGCAATCPLYYKLWFLLICAQHHHDCQGQCPALSLPVGGHPGRKPALCFWLPHRGLAGTALVTSVSTSLTLVRRLSMCCVPSHAECVLRFRWQCHGSQAIFTAVKWTSTAKTTFNTCACKSELRLTTFLCADPQHTEQHSARSAEGPSSKARCKWHRCDIARSGRSISKKTFQASGSQLTILGVEGC